MNTHNHARVFNLCPAEPTFFIGKKNNVDPDQLASDKAI